MRESGSSFFLRSTDRGSEEKKKIKATIANFRGNIPRARKTVGTKNGGPGGGGGGGGRARDVSFFSRFSFFTLSERGN